jgi:hypothetical protein
MRIGSALRHLRRRHSDCWSCRIEAIMCRAIMEGKGFIAPIDSDLLPWMRSDRHERVLRLTPAFSP